MSIRFRSVELRIGGSPSLFLRVYRILLLKERRIVRPRACPFRPLRGYAAVVTDTLSSANAKTISLPVIQFVEISSKVSALHRIKGSTRDASYPRATHFLSISKVIMGSEARLIHKSLSLPL